MNRLQVIILASVVSLFGVMLAFGRTVPSKKESVTASAPEMNLEDLLQQAKSSLDTAKLRPIANLESQLAAAKDANAEVEILKKLSGAWFTHNALVSATYSEKVADLLPSDTSYAIAAKGYTAAETLLEAPEMKVFAAKQTLKMCDKAYQYNPKSEYKINKGLMLVELSSLDGSVMPMEGVGVLKEVLAAEPENTDVIIILGRLAMRSGQYEKATERFDSVLSLGSANSMAKTEAAYLQTECYKALNNPEKVIANYNLAIKYADKVEIKKRLQADLDAFQNKK